MQGCGFQQALKYSASLVWAMVEMNLTIYTLGGVIVLLGAILVVKSLRRKKNTPRQNIWDVPVASQYSAPRPRKSVRPQAPPPANAFRQR